MCQFAHKMQQDANNTPCSGAKKQKKLCWSKFKNTVSVAPREKVVHLLPNVSTTNHSIIETPSEVATLLAM
jgi:hypothetical protein